MSSESVTASTRAQWANVSSECVVPGVHRIPLPLPDELTAVNVYAIETGDGLTLIDAGQALDRCRRKLGMSLGELGFTFEDIRQVLVTHAHRDHYTLGIELRREFGCRLRLGIREAASVIAAGSADWVPFRSQFAALHAGGAGDLVAEVKASASGNSMQASLWESPDSWVLDDERIDLGPLQLRAISTPGHTQGHLVFHEPNVGVLFSGDHLLPHITPSIGLEPIPGRSPLADFLASLKRIRALADSVLLPAHGPVIASAHERIDALLDHHRQRLELTYTAVADGHCTAGAVAAALTWSSRHTGFAELPAFHRMLAVVETEAHLRLLADRGSVWCDQSGGVNRYEVLVQR